MKKDTKQKYDEQTEDLYAAIGRFAVEFEHVCHRMRVIIMTILGKEGLANDKVMQILLSEQTAEPLRGVVVSLIYETQTLSDTDRKIVHKILKEIQDLTKLRNDVIHGTWFIGWVSSDDTEFTDALGIKFKKDKDGVATKNFSWKKNDFDELTEKAKELTNLLARLSGCISGNYKIENNFLLAADGSLSNAKHIYQ